MIRRTRPERRENPRIAQSLPLSIAANGYNFSTTSQNVSCVGTYCTVEKYIPPFTKLAVRLSLPVSNAGQQKKLCIETKGVVVRSEDSPDGRFNIAIFFNEIKDAQRKKISQYVSQFLSASPVS